VTDIDGNIYKTVKIGNQVWMAENLKTTHFRNGEEIPVVTVYAEWNNLTTAASCVYNNDSTKLSVYGRLYNGYAVSDNRNICPAGWHVPSKEEWETLISYLGGKSIAGGKLKEPGSAHWGSTNHTIDTISGFNALPGGRRDNYGAFYNIQADGSFWSSTEFEDTGDKKSVEEATVMWSENMDMSETSIDGYVYGKYVGLSVRCIKD